MLPQEKLLKDKCVRELSKQRDVCSRL